MRLSVGRLVHSLRAQLMQLRAVRAERRRTTAQGFVGVMSGVPLALHSYYIYIKESQPSKGTVGAFWKTRTDDDLQMRFFQSLFRSASHKRMAPANRPIPQISQCIRQYPTMHHFITEICTRVHISVTNRRIVGYGTDAAWDLCNWSIEGRISYPTDSPTANSLGLTVQSVGYYWDMVSSWLVVRCLIV